MSRSDNGANVNSASTEDNDCVREKGTNKIKPLDTVIALYDFPGTQPSHLQLNIGDTIQVLSKSDSGWWDGVMRDSSGDILRGWFPNNYVRSVNYVQPILKQIRSKKEMDSLTAANTTANILIPSFTSLLKKNLQDDRESSASGSRKNSIVSFASSDESVHEKQNLTACLKSGSNDLKDDTIPVVVSDNIALLQDDAAEEVEKEYRENRKKDVVWQPRISTTGARIYYSPQLGMYCKTPPSSRNSELSDNYVMQSPKDGQYNTALPNHLEKDSSDILDDNNDYKDPRKELDAILKRGSNASSLTSYSTNGSLYHHFSQPLFMNNDFFFQSSKDVWTWTDLKNKICLLIQECFSALQDFDRDKYGILYGKLNTEVIILVHCVRLVHNDFMKSKYEGSIRRKLKRIIRTFSQTYINSALHLNVMHYSGVSTDQKLFSFDIKNLNKSAGKDASLESENEADFSSKANPSVKTASVDSEASSMNRKESKDSEGLSYIDQVERDFINLARDAEGISSICQRLSKDKVVRLKDYNNSESSDNDKPINRYDILPQHHARFFKDEFNGGNFCNPFFTPYNEILNVGGNELKNKYHLKVIIDRDSYVSLEKLGKEMLRLCGEVSNLLAPEMQYLYYNDVLMYDRNHQVLRVTYRYLYYASLFLDTLESFDFTIFCLVQKFSSKDWDVAESGVLSAPNSNLTSLAGSRLSFDYPIVLKFFELKQIFHDLVLNVVLAAQSLTLEDPEVFKGMDYRFDSVFEIDPEDPLDKASLRLARILQERNASKKTGSIVTNCDHLLLDYITNGPKYYDQLLSVIRNLVDERETILNYATRVMHDEFNVQLLLIERSNTIATEKSDEVGGSYYGKMNSSTDVPWYLEGDNEHDLLLDIKGNIKGGTKEALVAHLTHHSIVDKEFNDIFLLMFPTMMSFGELVVLLINRFNIEAPEGLSYDEYNKWISDKQIPIRRRVLEILRELLEKCWVESYYKEPVLRKLLMFLQTPIVKSMASSKDLSKVVQIRLNRERKCEDLGLNHQSGKKSLPLFKLTPLKKIRLLDIDYVELTRQLTVMESKLYSKITKQACLCKVWGKRSGLQESIEHITNFIKMSNQMTNFVVYLILKKQDVRKRVYVMTYFIQIAEKCRQIKNFSSMTAIISALYASPIHRLKKTWHHVSYEALSNLRKMNKLMNSTRNFNEYRDLLKLVKSEPCIPFLGLYLSDLTFIFHGNPDHLPNMPRMLNFGKRAKTYKILVGLDKFNAVSYNFHENPDIQNYLTTLFEKCPLIEEQYELSLQVEPRDSIKSSSVTKK